MAKTESGTFETLNPNKPIFKKIKEEEPKWWKLFCEDKELYIDIRKDNYINVYYYGQSVARIKYKQKKIVAEINKTKPLSLETLNEGKIEEIKKSITKNPEGRIKGEMRLKNPNYIDSEFGYAKNKKEMDKKEIYIDLTELLNDELSFVELKRLADKRLLETIDDSDEQKRQEILVQMERYERFLKRPDQMKKIENYYINIIKLKNDLGIFKERREEKSRLIVIEKPKLIIVNEDKQTPDIEKRKEAIETLLGKHHIKYEIYNSENELYESWENKK